MSHYRRPVPFAVKLKSALDSQKKLIPYRGAQLEISLEFEYLGDIKSNSKQLLGGNQWIS
jgi:hypothetical protein